MAKTTASNPVEVKASPNVYTVLIIIALLSLLATIGIAGNRLMKPAPEGYGMEVGQMFSPFEENRKQMEQDAR